MTDSWRRMRWWGAAHAVDDLYQGLVPATLPYFVLEHHYSYLAISGLTLAAALGSSIPQPLIGVLVDRYRLDWLAAAGVALAGLGFGLSGLAGGWYPAVWTLILLSGLGVAMFHPAAGRAAREAAGDSAGAMSVFAAGGSVGFFLAPVLATPVLVGLGVPATVLFVLPALVVAGLLLRRRATAAAVARTVPAPPGADRWWPFLALTGIEVVRSAAFFGVNTFIELYWLRHLHAGHAAAGAALAVFLVGGVAGTLLGGRIADRAGSVRTVQAGALAGLPALAGLAFTSGPVLPMIFAGLAGAALNVPFAVLIKLGQDYLPSRPGTAAGVTLGLGVSIGGLFAPLFGLTAQHHGPGGVLALICLAPIPAFLLGLALTEPSRARRPVAVPR
ncbi:MFS transporter [Actinoplanes teichomyceticus]|uniref:FSR family fosmidomycin resistance protein-like MFS transporter n=1 Tax=Actinoplanes teichomyceticus TaxID=1867 RepID=A0A561VLX6_ACTTI|nr:MFS transporter [Actinoplanes teichomyceticus]TWG12625.1 FSR family fosmidomycin resistance protein-like MFS transporter [Actinoplanes teichomyceticus]GIF13995.1 MFS transporter [Actinoplanes teichomyceticus]